MNIDDLRPIAGSLLLSLGAAALLVGVCHDPRLVPSLSRYIDRIDGGRARMLARPIGLRLARAQMLLGALLLAGATAAGQPLFLSPIPLLFWLPTRLLARALGRRREAVEAQLDGWLMGLTSALRAAPALGDAIGSTITLVRGPMRAELSLLMRRFRMGTPLDEGLTDMSRRVGSPALTAALTTLRIARRTGGELGATLERSAEALREMARLEGVVRTKTASGRAQANTISALPILLVALLYWVEPTYLLPVATTAVGNALAVLSLVMWVTATVWAQRIVQVDL